MALTAEFYTEKGVMKAELYADDVPNTVNNFVKLAKEGFYDGLRFHRVIPNFVIQNNAEASVTYASVVEKVQAAITIQDVTSLDIYVKAEEGKAYYVVNGEAAGAVDLF